MNQEDLSILSKEESGLPFEIELPNIPHIYGSCVFMVRTKKHSFTYLLDSDGIKGDWKKIPESDLDQLREWVRKNKFALFKVIRGDIDSQQFKDVMIRNGVNGSTETQRMFIDMLVDMNIKEKFRGNYNV